MQNRRSFLSRALGAGAGLLAAPRLALAALPRNPGHEPRNPTVSTVTTEVGDLPFTMDGGTKVFHLVAQVIRQQIAPNKSLDLWGFNGSAPGPTIQINHGDHIRVVFENQLPEASSIHWHGFEDTIGNDGMPGISQPPVRPGERFVYEFDIHQEGTYFYHSHMAMQEMAGMLGAVVMHPRDAYWPHCDKDFVLHFQEYAVQPNSTLPDTMKMEFNWLLINGKAGPAATPLIVKQGERVRLRMINLGMDHHPIHLHGYTFHVTGTEGGRIQESAWWPGNTVLVGVAQSRTVELVATRAGDWMLHCHMPHHMMNQMTSQVGPMTRSSATRSMSIDVSDGQMNMPEPQMSAEQMRGSSAMRMDADSMAEQSRGIAADANNVPNFPQDAYMEGPKMDMEHTAMLDKPENLGLHPGWSPSMQGMMTFLRVLPPDKYDTVLARMRAAKRPNDPYASVLNAEARA